MVSYLYSLARDPSGDVVLFPVFVAKVCKHAAPVRLKQGRLYLEVEDDDGTGRRGTTGVLLVDQEEHVRRAEARAAPVAEVPQLSPNPAMATRSSQAGGRVVVEGPPVERGPMQGDSDAC